jgi:hypothetical protein
MANGLLAVAFDYTNVARDEFNDWYDTEHIPEREAVPGFGACERWLDVENDHVALATYDLDSLDVLRSEAYLAIGYANSSPWTKRVTGLCTRLLRFEGTQTKPGDTAAPQGAGGLLINAMNVTPEAEADLNAWYNEEHLDALAAVPGCLAARRYVAGEQTTSTHRYVAIYHLGSPDVTKSQAWSDAANTPWTERVLPHFRDRLRILTGRYRRAT